MKKAFVEALIAQATRDPKVMLLTGDLGFEVFDEFIRNFGPRYLNVGVAEAQMIAAAAGLALEGWRPFAYSIASFATARCFEQIKLAVAYHGLPVTIVGAGGGYAYARAGVTHHAGDDLGLMSLLPGMTVVAPGDVHEVKALLPQVCQLSGPAYFRIGRGREPEYPLDEPIVLGKARKLGDGDRRVAIVSTGEAGCAAYQAHCELKKQGIHVPALHFHTLKPLDGDALEALTAKVDALVVVDEHLSRGGLGSALSDWLTERGLGIQLTRLSVPDSFVLGSPSQTELRQRYGFDANGVFETVKQLLSKQSASEQHGSST